MTNMSGYGYIVIGFLWATFQVSVCRGDATISLTPRRYNNPEGEAANGHCCDGRWSLCQIAGCDYRFTFCLDDVTHAAVVNSGRVNDAEQCWYGGITTDTIRNEDSYNFGQVFGGLRSPLNFNILGALPSVMILKVDVIDRDAPYTENDFVDFLIGSFDLGSYGDTDIAQNGVTDIPFVIEGTREKHITSLDGRLSIRCVTDWYSRDCGQYCAPAGVGEHYRCNPHTGEKVCQDGWTGAGCDTTSVPPTVTSQVPTLDPGPVFIDRPNADCENLAQNGYRYQDGVYNLQVGHFAPFPAYCDMSAEGWTVIQQRTVGELSFNRNWTEYVTGFGVVGGSTEHWLGLEKIYWLTNQRSYRLRITMQIGNHEFRFANYENFWIESEANNFKLHVGGYSGTAGDAMNHEGYRGLRRHNNQPFSTPDRDHDGWRADNCAQMYDSGWWFNDCYWANLNGVYLPEDSGWPYCEDGRCVAWRTIEDYEDYSLIYTQMKIRPHDSD